MIAGEVWRSLRNSSNPCPYSSRYLFQKSFGPSTMSVTHRWSQSRIRTRVSAEFHESTNSWAPQQVRFLYCLDSPLSSSPGLLSRHLPWVLVALSWLFSLLCPSLGGILGSKMMPGHDVIRPTARLDPGCLSICMMYLLMWIMSWHSSLLLLLHFMKS